MLEGVITRSEQETDRATTLYSDAVHKTRMLRLKSYADTEDILQTVFLKYALHSGSFESNEHERAWVIYVTISACKDYLKSFFRSHTVPLEKITEVAGEMPRERNEVLEVVLPPPEEYRDAMCPFYYKDYTVVEISETLGRNVNTVYTLLARTRAVLREIFGGDGFE